jgi:amino acid transporter
MSEANQPNETQAKLGLWDAVSIILGIIIGVGIYETPGGIFRMMNDPMMAFGIWALCGVLALIGALCYAELATAYPRSGGDYVYLTRAYGPLVGYLFGWTQLAVIQTGSIGLMAYVFADYGNRVLKIEGLEGYASVAYASAAIIVMTLLNMLGVVLGKTAQNLLTFAKVVGLIGIMVAGFVYAPKEQHVFEGTIVSVKDKDIVFKSEGGKEKTFSIGPQTKLVIDGNDVLKDDDGKKETRVVLADFEPKSLEAILKRVRKKDDPHAGDTTVRIVTDVKDPKSIVKVRTAKPQQAPPFEVIAFAMVLVFLTYGGWNDAAFVAAEVRNPDKNIPRALIIGTAGVMIIYLLVNAAYFMGLGGLMGTQEAGEIAADVLKLLPWEHGDLAMSILVMVSALGAVNGLIYTSSRIYSTLGSDYSLFAALGQFNKSFGTPVWSLLLQMLITLAMVGAVGTKEGQDMLNEMLAYFGQEPVSWAGQGGFYSLLRCTAPVFWIFFLLTGMSLFILRRYDPNVPRPFRVPLFPILPLIFCATCGYMIYSGIGYAGGLALVGATLVLAGVPFFVFSRRSHQTDSAAA